MFKIALRNILRHQLRSLVTLSTIAFGCVALMFVAGFFTDTLRQMKTAYINSHLGNLQVFKKGFAKYSAANPFKYLIDDPDKIAALIRQLPQVKQIGYRLQFPGLISTGQAAVPCMVQGVDARFDLTFRMEDYKDLRALLADKEVYGRSEIAAGVGLSPTDPLPTVILGIGLAQAIGAVPDSYVTVLNTTVQGGNNAMDLKVKGLLSTSFKDFDDLFLRMPLANAQAMLNTSAVGDIVVRLRDTDATDAVKAQMEKLFYREGLDLEIKTWRELSDFYVKTEKLFDMFHLIMRVVISIAVSLAIFNTMNMAVMERFSEIGTMMAMGVSTGGILRLFLMEGMLLGTIGGGLGVALGAGVIAVIDQIGILMPPPPGNNSNWLAQPAIVGDVMVFTFFLCVVIGGFSALVPAFKASRLKIVEALRYR